jgi:hypothetical protein
MTRSRTWFAYLAGIAACAVVPALCMFAWMMVANDGAFETYMLDVFLFACVVAFAHALVLGAPYVALLRWRGWFGFLPMLIGGFIAGLLPFLLFSIGALLTRDYGNSLEHIWNSRQDLLLFATLGATGALAFYGAFRAAQPATD